MATDILGNLNGIDANLLSTHLFDSSIQLCRDIYDLTDIAYNAHSTHVSDPTKTILILRARACNAQVMPEIENVIKQYTFLREVHAQIMSKLKTDRDVIYTQVRALAPLLSQEVIDRNREQNNSVLGSDNDDFRHLNILQLIECAKKVKTRDTDGDTDDEGSGDDTDDEETKLQNQAEQLQAQRVSVTCIGYHLQEKFETLKESMYHLKEAIESSYLSLHFMHSHLVGADNTMPTWPVHDTLAKGLPHLRQRGPSGPIGRVNRF